MRVRYFLPLIFLVLPFQVSSATPPSSAREFSTFKDHEGRTVYTSKHLPKGASKKATRNLDDWRVQPPDLQTSKPFSKIAHLSILEVAIHPASSSITIVLTNTRRVDAEKISVRIASKRDVELSTRGPSIIEKGGIAAFEVFIPKTVLPGGANRVTKNQLLITCGNCG